jgi:hypothetical protein
MKKRLLFFCLALLSGVCARGQGQLYFANLISGVNAPVTNANGVRIVGPGPFVADLFYSSNTNADMNSLVAAGFNQPFSSLTGGGGGGWFLSGTKSLPVTGTILAQVRVWNTNDGAAFGQAQAAPYGEWGMSTPFLLTLGMVPAPPPTMIGLHGFQLLHSDPGAGPTILSQPKSQIVAIGSTVTLRVQAASTTPLVYQWYFNGTNLLAGAIDSSLTLTNVQLSHSGSYTVAITNDVASATSTPATLTVLPALEVNLIPALTLVGSIGSSNRIEYRTLGGPTNDWIPLTTLVLTSNPQIYLDYSALGQPARFYRMVQLP